VHPEEEIQDTQLVIQQQHLKEPQAKDLKEEMQEVDLTTPEEEVEQELLVPMDLTPLMEEQELLFREWVPFTTAVGAVEPLILPAREVTEELEEAAEVPTVLQSVELVLITDHPEAEAEEDNGPTHLEVTQELTPGVEAEAAPTTTQTTKEEKEVQEL
jgi:hypothetical protein